MNRKALLNMVYPRVLIISHNVMSSNGNMGKTLSNFFYGWDKNNISQLYFHSEIPLVNICQNYYRITDVDIIKSIIFKRNIGNILKSFSSEKEVVTSRIDTGLIAKIYQTGKNFEKQCLMR